MENGEILSQFTKKTLVSYFAERWNVNISEFLKTKKGIIMVIPEGVTPTIVVNKIREKMSVFSWVSRWGKSFEEVYESVRETKETYAISKEDLKRIRLIEWLLCFDYLYWKNGQYLRLNPTDLFKERSDSMTCCAFWDTQEGRLKIRRHYMGFFVNEFEMTSMAGDEKN